MKDVILDLRDERGRFFCRPRIPAHTYAVLVLYAQQEGITFEDVLHRAIAEYAREVGVDKSDKL